LSVSRELVGVSVPVLLSEVPAYKHQCSSQPGAQVRRLAVLDDSLYVQPRPSALNMTLPAFTAQRGLGTGRPQGAQQQTSHLPPGRSGIPAFTAAESGTRFSDPGKMQS